MTPRSAGARLGTLGLAIALVAAACGTPVETAKSPPPTIAPTAAISPGLPPTVEPATEPSPTEPATRTAPAGTVIEDPSLLSVLPADLGGIAVNREAQAFVDAAADTAFADSVESAAFAVVVDGDDLASAVVARPIEGAFSEGFFRDWRDAYNQGACAQAGGVVGNAESDFEGRTVYIGTCAAGLRTYHAWLDERGLLVSAFSLGDRRFGEQLMAGLRP